MENLQNLFIKALEKENNPADRITVFFKDGRKATYTMNCYTLLQGDPSTKEIIDAETGEILFTK